jgi:hypothetical protein
MNGPRQVSPVRVRDVLLAAQPDLRERVLEDAVRRDWSHVVGTELGRRSRPGRLKAGVLDVVADNSPWLHELTLRSGELLAALQTRFGSAVASLRFGVGVLTPCAHPPPCSTPPPRARLTHEETRCVDAMVALLPDPMLAGSLRRLLTKDMLAGRRDRASHRDADAPSVEREDS